MIRADRLSKRYGDILALDEVTFEVRPGEILGFLGPNGAGKTTALRVLCGYLPPTRGAASVAGLDLTRQSLAARGKLGYLPEAFAAPPELRVGEYLRFRAGLKGVAYRQRRRRVGEVVARLGLEERSRQLFGSLSKGFRQRVGLADSLLASPPALLLDEPFGGLDPMQRQEFRRLLRELAGAGIAILFSSHVLPEVEELAHRVLILHRGRARAEGTFAELCRAAEQVMSVRVVTGGDPDELAQAWDGNDDWAGRCPITHGENATLLFQPDSPAARDALFQWLARREEPVVEFRTLQPSLEELFEQVVGREGPPEARP